MSRQLLPTTQEIREIVVEEIGLVQGTVLDCFDDGHHLFLRTVLPMIRDVLPNDKVQGGVAVLAGDPDVSVHPYTFRQVCRNGAIVSEVIQSRCVRLVDFSASSPAIEEVKVALREAVRVCSTPNAFLNIVARMRSAVELNANMILDLLPLLSHWPRALASAAAERIARRFQRDGDRSLFGLVNAVTSVARDERDPTTRWRLEELGGAILSNARPVRRPSPPAARPLPASMARCCR